MVNDFKRPEDTDAPEARKSFIEQMLEEIRADKKHFSKDFQAMCDDMELCRRGAPAAWPTSNYVVNITQRFVRQKVAALYAKNPRAQAKRKRRLWYQVWDEKPESLQAAMVEVAKFRSEPQPPGTPPPMEAMALLQEVQSVNAHKKMLDKLGKTLEVLFHYFTHEQLPDFKSQMKKCVRSAVQTAVGYVRMGYQREHDVSREISAEIADHQMNLRRIETLMTEMSEDNPDKKTEYDSEAEELRLTIKTLEESEVVIGREGILFDIPNPTSIIPDRKCTSLKGWVDSDRLTEEIFMTPDEIKDYYKIDLGEGGASYNKYKSSGAEYKRNPRSDVEGKFDDMACVWVCWHKPSGRKYTLMDGYDDYMEEPSLPDVKIERFFPIYALCYNEVLHSAKLFPPSDVRYMSDPQQEYNRTRQGLREHRKANRPGYASAAGALDDEDKSMLGQMNANDVIEIEGLSPGQKVTDILQALPKVGVDPNLYETSSVMNDIMLSVGAQEASFGATSGSTATEAAIAESNRSASLEAEIDELNDFLSHLARDSGQVLLLEMDEQTVKVIAGDGAVWPKMNREQIASEVSLEVIAGSNGRPNRALRQQAMQQLLPFLIQIPGINPHWLARTMVEAIDDSLDLTDAITESMPSITAMNNMQQPDQGSSPQSQQGPSGANNAAKGPASEGDSRGPGRPPMQFPHVAGGEVS